MNARDIALKTLAQLIWYLLDTLKVDREWLAQAIIHEINHPGGKNV